MSMHNLSESIQLLLHLQKPLPRSLAHNLRVGNKSLLKMHDDFTDIASEMRVWTFYETIDSQLSGSGYGVSNEVKFSAPLVSIKSALVNVRQEIIYSSLESDHAHCASFGISNPRTLNTYLLNLAAAISKAAGLSQSLHTPLKLKEKVKAEIIGFYEDPDAATESDIRLYITKYHLAEFLQKGPERCLEERLQRVSHRPGSGRHQAVVRGSGHEYTSGFVGNVQKIWRGISRSSEQERPASPDIFVQPPGTDDGRSRVSLGRRPHSLTIPTLSPPGFGRPSSRASNGTTSTMSDPTGQEVSPKEATMTTQRAQDPRSKSETDQMGLGITSRNQTEKTSKTAALQDLTAGFSRPNPDQRKFMWIHLPFTNPVWVKVCRNCLVKYYVRVSRR